MADSFYSTDNLDGNRYLILSDVEQVMPATRCKVTAAKMETSTSSGKTFPILEMEDEEGNQYRVCAWKRDVTKCLKQWGGVPPTDWGFVSFISAQGGKRYEIAPSSDQTPKPEDVA